MIHYLYCKVKVFEVPMHAYHDLSRLIAYPFRCNSEPQEQTGELPPSIMAPVYMRVAVPFMEACHSLLDAFASTPADVLGGCPTVPFVRAMYAISGLRLVAKKPLLDGDVGVQGRIEDIQGRVDSVMVTAVGDQKRQIPSTVLDIWRRIGGNRERRRATSSFIHADTVIGEERGNDNGTASTPETQTAKTGSSSRESLMLGLDQSQAFIMESIHTGSSPTITMIPGFTQNFAPLPDYSCALRAQSNLENQMMDTFLNGFGVADLVT